MRGIQSAAVAGRAGMPHWSTGPERGRLRRLPDPHACMLYVPILMRAQWNQTTQCLVS